MIELERDALVFSFADVHSHAVLRAAFIRTLRVPDDNREYTLPDLGTCPLRSISGDGSDGGADGHDGMQASADGHDGTAATPHEDVALPLHREEAVWLSFAARGDYPFAVKATTGGVNAITGAPPANGLHRSPQDYLVAPLQTWRGGYRDGDRILQFTAIATQRELCIEVIPLSREAHAHTVRGQHDRVQPASPVCYSPLFDIAVQRGNLHHEIVDDPYAAGDWAAAIHRVNVRLVPAHSWRALTGDDPPQSSGTEPEYRRAGIPPIR